MKNTLRSPLGWLGGLLALYLLIPILAFAIRLAVPGERGFTQPGLWGALGVSLLSATISTTIMALLGIPLAYVLARSRSRLAGVVGILVQLPLALPPVMSGIILIYLVGPYTFLGRLFDGQLTGTVTGIVIAQTFVASPFLIITARSAFSAVDPRLEDLAASLGHGPLARFWRVSVRVALPGLRAGLTLAWLRAIGEYGATVLLSYHPYSLPVFTYVQFSSTGIPTTEAPTALALGIAVVVVAVSLVRLPHRRRAAALSGIRPRAPRGGAPTRVAFALDQSLGGFHLRLAHESRSARIAILGPSGSGKSVTLRAIAGLAGPGVGTVRLNDRSVEQVPPQARRIGYVPQGGILIPGMTVWEQVLFGVGAEPALALWWLQTLQLEGLQDHLPEQLSGGQRQRVALAQAMSREPGLVLLDEPFSALDAPVREDLRRRLRRLQHELGLSTVLVTHDPEEAAFLAEEILVIENGALVQAGSRNELYRRPSSPRVARLLGIPNLNHGVISAAGSIVLVAGGARLEVGPHGLEEGAPVLWSIRPEAVGVGDAGRYAAVLSDVVELGSVTVATVRLEGGPELTIRSTEPIAGRPGDGCRVEMDPAAISVWPDAGIR